MALGFNIVNLQPSYSVAMTLNLSSTALPIGGLLLENLAFPGEEVYFNGSVCAPSFIPSLSPIPDPTTIALLGFGLAGLAGIAQ